MSEEKIYDLVIIGAGPAGLTAALYAARGNLDVLIVDKGESGALYAAHKIDNYIGILDEPSGPDLLERMKKHALKFGAEYTKASFLELDVMNEPKVVKTDMKKYTAKTVIVASGLAKWGAKKLKGEEEFIGKGVSYCATCDGAFFKNMTVAVFGNGEEAAEEAMFLTEHAGKVLFFVNDDKIDADEDILNTLKASGKVEFHYNTELKEVEGSKFVERVRVEEAGEEKVYETEASFLYLGTKSNAELYSMFAEMDDKGHIITNEKMETMMPGVYAVGDIRKKELRQVVTAAADGAIAGVEVIKYVMKNR